MSEPSPIRAAPGRAQKERERFVAFAFCWADVLLELDGEGSIAYAAGTTQTFTGTTPDKLIGRAFLDLVADPEEAHDVAAARPDVVARMERLLDREHRPDPAWPLPFADPATARARDTDGTPAPKP